MTISHSWEPRSHFSYLESQQQLNLASLCAERIYEGNISPCIQNAKRRTLLPLASFSLPSAPSCLLFCNKEEEFPSASLVFTVSVFAHLCSFLLWSLFRRVTLCFTSSASLLGSSLRSSTALSPLRHLAATAHRNLRS